MLERSTEGEGNESRETSDYRSSTPHPDPRGKNENAAALGRLGGLKGGRARAEKLSPEERRRIAQVAAAARWNKTAPVPKPAAPATMVPVMGTYAGRRRLSSSIAFVYRRAYRAAAAAAVFALLMVFGIGVLSGLLLSTSPPPAGGDVAPGGQMLFEGEGYAPLSEVEVWVYSDPILLTITFADDRGRVSVLVTIPADLELGSHTLEGTGILSLIHI